MTFNGLLFKIETGQALSDRQTKKLAQKLFLTTSSIRSLLHTVWIALIIIVILLGALNQSFLGLGSYMFYVVGVVLILFIILFESYLKRQRLNLYFESVENFYAMKFKGFDYYDLFYIGQHRSPNVRTLKSNKIYLLSDGHHLLFVDDYFKNTTYELPKFLQNETPTYLKVIDTEKTDQSRVLIDISEVDYYFLSSKDILPLKTINNAKYHTIFEMFLNPDNRMDEHHFVNLKLYNGAVFRLGCDAYEALKFALPLKDKTK